MCRIEFKCPRCAHNRYEEIMVDVTVASDMTITEDGDGVVSCYGDQTSDSGHVERYQCQSCGFVILDDSPKYERYTQCGLDEHALALRLKSLAAAAVLAAVAAAAPVFTKCGDTLSYADVISRISEVNQSLGGEELAVIWNNSFPSSPIVYDGDSIFSRIEQA